MKKTVNQAFFLVLLIANTPAHADIKQAAKKKFQQFKTGAKKFFTLKVPKEIKDNYEQCREAYCAGLAEGFQEHYLCMQKNCEVAFKAYKKATAIIETKAALLAVGVTVGPIIAATIAGLGTGWAIGQHLDHKELVKIKQIADEYGLSDRQRIQLTALLANHKLRMQGSPHRKVIFQEGEEFGLFAKAASQLLFGTQDKYLTIAQDYIEVGEWTGERPQKLRE